MLYLTHTLTLRQHHRVNSICSFSPLSTLSSVLRPFFSQFCQNVSPHSVCALSLFVNIHAEDMGAAQGHVCLAGDQNPMWQAAYESQHPESKEGDSLSLSLSLPLGHVKNSDTFCAYPIGFCQTLLYHPASVPLPFPFCFFNHVQLLFKNLSACVYHFTRFVLVIDFASSLNDLSLFCFFCYCANSKRIVVLCRPWQFVAFSRKKREHVHTLDCISYKNVRSVFFLYRQIDSGVSISLSKPTDQSSSCPSQNLKKQPLFSSSAAQSNTSPGVLRLLSQALYLLSKCHSVKRQASIIGDLTPRIYLPVLYRIVVPFFSQELCEWPALEFQYVFRLDFDNDQPGALQLCYM